MEGRLKKEAQISMKIARLEFRNCLGISELEHQAGKINLISGDNEKGKTSVLEAIEKALYNTDRRVKFVKDGEDVATLYVELDDGLTVDRKVKRDGQVSIKVEKDGASIKKPETFLKGLIGEHPFAFNPVDFMQKKDKEQTEILLSLIPMRVTEEDLKKWFGEVPPVNLNQHAIHVLAYLAEKYYYDMRHIANGEVKECESEITSLFNQLPDNYNGDKWRNVNIGELWNKVREAEQVNSYRDKAQQIIDGQAGTVEGIKNKYDLKSSEAKEYCQFRVQKIKEGIDVEKKAIQSEITDYEEQIRQLQEKIKLKKQELSQVDNTAQLKIESAEKERDSKLENIEEQMNEEINKAETKAIEAQSYLDNNPAVEVEPLQKQAEEAEKMKGFISLWDSLQKLRKDFREKKDRADKLDDFVNLARRKPAELMKQAKMPVKGLGINDDMQITIDGLPIKNLSTSRQIKLALDIARATAGPLKLICIDRFESLSPKNQKVMLGEMEKDDFQYFISTVSNDEMKVQVM